MQVRIWGPAQEDLVEKFRRHVSNAPAHAKDAHPYYVALLKDGEIAAVMRIEDSLSDAHSDFNDMHKGPQIHLSELTCKRDVNTAAAVEAMTPAISQLILYTYQTYRPIRVTFGFTDDVAICERLVADLSKLCEAAAYRFKAEVPKSVPAPAYA